MIRKKKQKTQEIEFEIASDNIFADIGIDNPEEELTKAELAWEIEKIIRLCPSKNDFGFGFVS